MVPVATVQVGSITETDGVVGTAGTLFTEAVNTKLVHPVAVFVAVIV